VDAESTDPRTDLLAEQIQSPTPELAESGAFRTRFVDGVELYELDVDGHVLRRRVDDGRVHVTSLLRLLSNKPPLSDFTHLDGASQDAWVPLPLARDLVKGRSISQELARFLDDSHSAQTPETDLDSFTSHTSAVESIDPSATQVNPVLLPAFEPTSKPQSSDKAEEHPPPSRRTAVVYDKDLLNWQHDRLAAWQVRMDLESTIAFPHLAYVCTKSPDQISLHSNNESPLSPQEEEIFHSLVDLGTSIGKSSERDRGCEEELEEDVLEADDEQEEESHTQLRRSKRVAARSVTTRTKGPQPVSRRRVTRAK